MRIILAIIALAAVAWCGWWFVVSGGHRKAMTGWIDERRAAGWVAEAARVQVSGFPYRIDTTVTGLALADPKSGWSWTAPEFRILSLAYQPHHIIAVWPPEQVIGSPYETTRVTSADMRGSVVFEPNRDLALDRATIEIAGLTLAGESGWQAAMSSAVLATKQAEPGTAPLFSHDIALTAEGVTPPGTWTAGLKRTGVLPEAIESLRLDATLVFDRPWDRASVEGDNPALMEVRIKDATFVWGALELRGKGELVADAEGYAKGKLDLRARNWREMLDVAEASGAFAPSVGGALRGGLELMARLSGDRNTLSVPLEFEGGSARLGPIPIGGAPRLARRG